MAAYGFRDRLKDFLTSRRFAWILLVTLGALVLLYFLFVTLFFNPFEDELEDTAAIVAADVDWFVRWQDAGAQFGEFPTPLAWDAVRATPAYAEVSASGALTELDARLGVGGALAALEGMNSYLPVGVSLTGDLLREVALAGKGPLRFDAGFEGMVMLRCSFKIKAGLAFLGFGSVRERLPDSLQIEDAGDGVYKLPQFEPFGFQDAYLSRIRDVLLLTSRREMIERARELVTRSGQESLATASAFHDNVSAYLAPGDRPIEVFLRWKAIGPQVGVLPDPNATGAAARALGRFFRTDLLRTAAGYARLESDFRLRMSGDLDASTAPEFMRGWLETNVVGASRLQEYAGMTPAESFFFGAVAGDPHPLFVEFYDLFAGDLRQILDESVQSAGRYQGMMDLLRDVGDMFTPGLCVAMRRNDYPVSEKDPEHDGAPVPLFALIGRTRDPALYEKLRGYFELNWARFTGGAAQKQEEVKLEGGSVMRSFVSPIIPGTGEIVVLRIPTLEMVIVSNSAKYVSSIFQATFAQEGTPAGDRFKLSAQPGFRRALASSENGAQAFLYFDPQEARHWLEATSIGAARVAFRAEREAAWRERRPALEAAARERLFPRQSGDLSPAQAQQVADAVDRELLAAEEGSARRIGELAEVERRAWMPLLLLDWASCGFRVSRRTAALVLDAQLAGG